MQNATGGRILVVEDERLVAAEIVHRLTGLGHEVVGRAGTAEEAVAIARRERPELALMDVRLGGSADAVDAARAILAEHDLAVVFLTAYADRATLERVREVVPFGYLLKPIDERALALTLETALHRFRAERAVREARERSSAVLRTCPDAVVVVDGAQRVVALNPAAEQLLDVRAADATGHVVPALAPLLAAADTLRFPAPDGGVRLVEVRRGTVPAGREHADTVFFLRDVTELRQLQDRLVHAQRMEAVGRLAGGVAHDLANLLVAVELNAWMAREATPRELVVHLDEISAAVAHASAVSRQLLALQGERRVDARVTDVNTTIREIGTLLARTMGACTLTLSLQEVPAVRMVPGHIEQIVLNLAVNAREAMRAGGRLEIATVSEPRVPPGVVIRVSDTGPGIPPERLDRIWEPFFSTKPHGTGLGLPTVRDIVEGAGGTISVRSTVGRGTVFQVRLPGVVGRPAPAPLPGVTPSVAAGTRVMVVDPTDLSRRAVVEALHHRSFRVSEALSAGHALLRVEASEPWFDVAVVDEVVPGMTSAELVSLLRRARPGLAVVVMGIGSDDGVGDAWCTKPFAPSAMVDAIQAAMAAVRYRATPVGR